MPKKGPVAECGKCDTCLSEAVSAGVPTRGGSPRVLIAFWRATNRLGAEEFRLSAALVRADQVRVREHVGGLESGGERLRWRARPDRERLCEHVAHAERRGALQGKAPTTQVSAAAWQSSKASPKHATAPSPSPPGRRRAPRHRATTRRATAHRRLTRGISACGATPSH